MNNSRTVRDILSKLTTDEVKLSLRTLRKAQKYQEFGICSNFRLALPRIIDYHVLEKLQITLVTLMTHWPKFSGNLAYPVPSGHEHTSPLTMYDLTTNQWDKSTEYGRLRYELLEFLIDTYTTYLQATNLHEYIIYYSIGDNGQGAETVFAISKRAATTIFRRTCKQRNVERTITKIIVLADEE